MGNEDTVLSTNMTDQSTVLIISEGGSRRIQPIMWFRTKKTAIQWSDYTNVNTEYWDALRFRAKRDVYFCGCGMIKTYDNE